MPGHTGSSGRLQAASADTGSVKSQALRGLHSQCEGCRGAARRGPSGCLVKVEKSLPVRHLLLSALNRQEVRQKVGRRCIPVCLMQAKRAMGLHCCGVLPGRGVHCMRCIRRNGLGTLGGADCKAFCTIYACVYKRMGQCGGHDKQQSNQHGPPHRPRAAQFVCEQVLCHLNGVMIGVTSALAHVASGGRYGKPALDDCQKNQWRRKYPEVGISRMNS